jgi:two-component system, NarL family, nitrate/nitrite response regulator NarL
MTQALEIIEDDPAERGALTRRETEILGLLAAGMATPDIARRLSISITTVRNHIQRVMEKLRVHSRLAAVARGYAQGLVDWKGPSRER